MLNDLWEKDTQLRTLQLGKPWMSISRRLFLMAFLACLPIALLATYLGISNLRSFEQATHGRANEIATVIRQTLDGELETAIAGMRALARSHSLGESAETKDLKDFYSEAVDLVHDRGTNILMIERDGSQVFNTVKPLGAILPKTNAPDVLARVFNTGQPVISNVFVGAVLQKPLARIIHGAIAAPQNA